MSKAFWKYSLAGLLVLLPAWATFLILSALLHALNDVIQDLPWNIGTRQSPGLSLVLFLVLVVIRRRHRHPYSRAAHHHPCRTVDRSRSVGPQCLHDPQRDDRSSSVPFSFRAQHRGGLSLSSRRSLGDRICHGNRTVGAAGCTSNKFVHGLRTHGHPSVHRLPRVCPSATAAPDQSATGRRHQDGVYRRFVQAGNRMVTTS